ncbi:hypothetical protein D9757_000497 [Collybiopsis confluens]|uniref:Aminoglycoside phosphotransferase domain-containing protein n=1 Tax=Collybiopsis confluens TaxID=2823264 RepID=A0A8H5I1J9_9AGAR|nr:hypothetical protein D9757_000497 [Collybiopsis confluens]
MLYVDWPGVDDPWIGVNVDLVALQCFVCQVFHISMDQCGPPVVIGLQPEKQAGYARVYSLQIPPRNIIARLVAPAKPLFKTESEVAAMDFVRHHISLPVPVLYIYCSEATWDPIQLSQKKTLARDLVDVYDQLYRLKEDGCGGIYYGANPTMYDLASFSRSPRWALLSPESLRLLRSHCHHPIKDGYELGPIHDILLINYQLMVPTPSQTMPVFSSKEYVKLIAFNGLPPTRSYFDIPIREKCVELFQHIQTLYPKSPLFGEQSDASSFRFSHGNLREGNILIDPQSGEITGVIDWEAAAFRPSWATVLGVGWFEEDSQ